MDRASAHDDDNDEAMRMTSMMMTIATQVKWYLDGILLRKLPDCSNGTARCNMVSSIITNSYLSNRSIFKTSHNFTITITTWCSFQKDPSKVILESVRRIFHGNYSCQVSMFPYCCVLLLLPLILLCIIIGATIISDALITVAS